MNKEGITRFKVGIILGLLFAGVTTMIGCGISENKTEIHGTPQEKVLIESVESDSYQDKALDLQKAESAPNNIEEMQMSQQTFILPEGETLETRIAVPEGYERIGVEDGSLTAFLRNYAMKEDGSPVLLYDGREKYNQTVHAAVFELPIEEADLQQCADSIMRVYAEYYWQNGQYDKIGFHFTNGFWCDYVTWREGYRVHVNGNNVSWSKDASYDDSYECFVKYLRMVFNYAGTLSMDSLETETISLSEMTVGDVILTGGSPGHVVMVADVCVNEVGEKAFLLAQGYMPAQEFHVLNNPLHEQDPWYYETEMTFPLSTAEYVFSDESMVQRLSY